MIETLPPEELEWRAQHSQAQQIRIQTAQASQSNRGMLIVDIPKFQQQRLSKESDFIQWYVDDYMPSNLPDAAQGFKQAELNTLIKNGRNQAIQQGFVDPQNQVHFVTLMWQVGANFYDTPAFKKPLQNDKFTEAERIEQFFEVSDDEMNQSIQQANKDYWLKERL